MPKFGLPAAHDGDEGLVTNLSLPSHTAQPDVPARDYTKWPTNEYKTTLSGLLAAGHKFFVCVCFLLEIHMAHIGTYGHCYHSLLLPVNQF